MKDEHGYLTCAFPPLLENLCRFKFRRIEVKQLGWLDIAMDMFQMFGVLNMDFLTYDNTYLQLFSSQQDLSPRVNLDNCFNLIISVQIVL